MMLTAASLAELKERILSRCVWRDGPLDTPCLIYTGTLSSGRYGSIGYQGKTLRTQRVLWICEYGEIEEGKEICHNCHVYSCNNLAHLRADTRSSNVLDEVRRGRWHKEGENNGQATIAAVQVSYIKYFLQQGWSGVLLAGRYRVRRSLINQIGSGYTWAHIKPFRMLRHDPHSLAIQFEMLR
jgi:hypothetical protein